MPDTELLVSNFAIELDGAPAPADLASDVIEISVEQSLHLPAVAAIQISDPQLKWIDDSRFEPGAAVKISAGFGNETSVIFEGEIVELEPVFAESGVPALIVRGLDKLHRLGRGSYVRTFLNVTDGDVIKKIAGEVGLQARVGQTKTLHPYLIQAGQTNLEFLQQRAASLGYLLYVDGSTLVCEAARASGAAVELKMFEDLVEFRPRMSTAGQINEVTVRGWDPKKKQAVIGKARKGNAHPQVGYGKGGGDAAKKAFSLDAPYAVVSGAMRDQGAADALAQAVADRHDARFIQAEGLMLGSARLRAGGAVKISGVGTRFGGTYFVTACTHRFDLVSGYTSSFNVSGMQPATLTGMLASDEPSVTAAGAVGYNLMIGIVTDNNDPENLGRVKIKFPLLSDEHASHWARVAAPDAGNNRGFEFIPEVNDEVVVGFEAGDINYPIVLGGLWNGQDKAPLSSSEAIQGGKVIKRVIRSRTGHEITIDDTDDKGGITIKDKNGNSIVLTIEQDKLTITSKGDMTLDTKGNLTLKTAKKLLIEATGAGEIKAMGLSMDGKTGNTEVKGMGVKVDGGAATVDVKGSMINLN